MLVTESSPDVGHGDSTYCVNFHVGMLGSLSTMLVGSREGMVIKSWMVDEGSRISARG